ncbi:unnamed protein product [Prorocentrum cordatum]|uniref:Uncharacterized protein n=1 Tax=Prorocentrum cordatum TaxID=2364126 RepID=A0ABN9QIX2_9DINO|nr:unnamed protein product [Polarella glacialis]
MAPTVRRPTKCGRGGPRLRQWCRNRRALRPRRSARSCTRFLDGQAALAVESVDLAETSVESGEEVVIALLVERFSGKVAADRLGEAKREAATGQEAMWLKDVRPMRFRGFDDGVQVSIGAVELYWVVWVCRVTFGVHVVPAGFLMSKPDLKAQGAAIDRETDSMCLKRFHMPMPLKETAAGRCEIILTF